MEPFKPMSFLLSQVCELYLLVVTEELERCGFTKPQLLVIQQLKQGPKTIGEISQQISLSYSTTSGIIDRLERDRVVVRQKDEKDRRIVWVSLVDNLKDLEEKIPFLQDQYTTELFEGIKPEEVEGIMHSLAIIHKCLERKWDVLMREKGSDSR